MLFYKLHFIDIIFGGNFMSELQNNTGEKLLILNDDLFSVQDIIKNVICLLQKIPCASKSRIIRGTNRFIKRD